MASSGTQQTAFNAGELEETLWERTELKYFATGASHAENVEIVPQGGFRQRPGTRDLGAVASDAARLIPFKASSGLVYDLVVKPAQAAVWSATAQLATVTLTGVTADMLPELTWAQSLDTLLVFHRDLQSLRVKHSGPTSWASDNLPFENLPIYDYGADIDGDPYTNAVAAEWELEFSGLSTSPVSVFTLTVTGQQTVSIEYNSDMATLAGLIQTAILDLPNTGTGITVASSGIRKVTITFGGTDNIGDGWAVTGLVINKTDAAILAFKKTPGVAPGEAIISTDRGWPQCGAFYGQRLLIGGLKSLPNTWAMSAIGDYYNFDERLNGDGGPAVIPMDVSGGEAIERIIAGRNLAIFTSEAEYWLAERALSRNAAPNHVKSSEHGTRRGVPIVGSDGAFVYCQTSGGVLGEFRYTDVEGNFVSNDISLLASHLVVDVVDMALRKSSASTDGNRLCLVLGSGEARLVTMLREQEITAFSRLTSPGAEFIATSVNARNENLLIVDRPASRRLERLEDDLLLDEAVTIAPGAPTASFTGLERFNGREIWAIGDNDVFGPFTPVGGAVTLPVEIADSVTFGTWAPPVITTLPMSREIAAARVVLRKGRIHTVHINVTDTTSLAIAANGGPLRDVALRRFGDTADVPELEAGYSGKVTIEGLQGFVDSPTLTISQVRPGRLKVKSVTIEAVL